MANKVNEDAMTMMEVAAKLGVSVNTVKAAIKTLGLKKGWLEQPGKPPVVVLAAKEFKRIVDDREARGLPTK